ncbi:MAG: quinoprotein dehydrogenase-associated putative ABC transporter substrate-binding protein [Gammaproteobacteria bacterium]|nr:quinoprotein dehydrogenase-associated putative ABC transporter substrate-binding protein [Gammaproteobacteria bacterium]
MIRLAKLSMMIIGMLLNSSFVQAGEFKPLPGQTAVRVCADAYNLPYSNDKFEGFDNKIAAIIADELGIPVEYYWFPQRIGFARNTIKKTDPETGQYLCDVAMSIPAERGIYSPTKPYFSSIETMVYRTGEGYELNEISDIAKISKEGKKLKIGLFDRAIATEKLLADGLSDQIEYYQMMAGDAKVIPGRLVEEELASGRIDVAFAWGPIAGYFANKSSVAMKVVPLNELGEDFVFSFGLGVRHQDEEWRDLLNKVLEKRKDDIQAVLADYHFPSLANVKPSIKNKKQVYNIVDGKVDDKTYVGWRVFNTTCFVCHGQDATGDIAPNLVERVADMSEFKFRKQLLKRYFAKVNLDDPNRRMEFLSQLGEAQAAKFKMPTWSDDPYIRSHISELYAYLKARADGALGEGKPERLE